MAGGATVDTITLLGIALGLAMDAFAVAIVTGIVLGDVSGRQTFRLAWHFGFFQFMMPVIGWRAGLSVERYISGYDHWLAFGLLAFIGGRMIYEAFWGDAERAASDPTRGISLVLLSLATSVDALAVGLSLGVLRIRIWYPAVVIGIVACVLTAAGMHLGRPLGARFGRRMEIAGGLVLIGIGVKILWQHLLH
ncbi:MAG: manganese efflux pump [Deltaproteobacteria bacterium]|nr:manganese efflux pump [Deltaproteobacteria bacterium]